MPPKSRNADAVLARLASLAKGIVTRGELLAAGVSHAEIAHRLASGSLIREYRGVFRVGHAAPSVQASYMAAVKACGPGAVLCGRAAAWLWGLIKGKPPPPEVSAPTERRVKGLKTRRRRLRPDERGERHGIPITSVALTLVDIAPSMTAAQVASACHEAGVRHRTTPRQVEATLKLRPNAPGARNLRAVIRGDEPVVLSRLERRFLEILREHDLPIPITNKPKGSYRVDCRWPEHRLTVELQSYRFHNSRQSWETDHRRRREALARGDRFRQYTWDDMRSPQPMLRELLGLFGSDYQR